MKALSPEEVLKHNKIDDLWVIVSGKVYDLSTFDHPGGKKILLTVAGKDATEQFKQFHNMQDVLNKHGSKLCVGEISSGEKNKKVILDGYEQRKAKYSDQAFGELIPYADPNWYHDFRSPYYNDSHRRFREAMREFVNKEIVPNVNEWSDVTKSVPREVHEKSYKAGWLPGCVGKPWPTEFAGPNIAGGVKPEEWDYFHELIIYDELLRCGAGGVSGAIITGVYIGLPPVLRFGSDYLKRKVCQPVLMGKKVMCLAITEPHAGSDVANIQTTAVKTPDGKHYIVNGEKKWITNGTFADFFTVAVRTGGSGMGGISLLLIERCPGLTTRAVHTSGGGASGTSYITFEDVKVPVENLIGQENQGFKLIMFNFNHERWGIVIQANRSSRVCYEEAFKYAVKRKTFGKRLVDHPVIRMKFAHMARNIEATHAWLENVTHQMNVMDPIEAAKKLGGSIALLKAQATLTFELCAREASQIMGGISVTKGGQGAIVERLYREVRGYAIPGGSEEIMLDLGVRQAMSKL